MKKLMFLAVSAVCGVALANTAVESANVVGYVQNDLSGKNWACVSFGFMTVDPDGDGVFKMKDIAAANFDAGSDTLQMLEPTRARAVKFYFNDGGYWYEDPENYNEADEDQFDLGTGFLANIASGSVALTDAGQVPVGPTSLDLSGKNWVMIGNPLPRDVKFGEIEAVNFDAGSDTLQVLESTRARAVKFYFNDTGVWYEDPENYNDASEDVLAAGEAILGNVASGSVKLVFPSAL